jgi:hypothetical protein
MSSRPVAVVAPWQQRKGINMTHNFALSGTAQAGELTPYAAESMELGSIRDVTYYTEVQEAYKLVTTLADGDTGVLVLALAALAAAATVATITAARH